MCGGLGEQIVVLEGPNVLFSYSLIRIKLASFYYWRNNPAKFLNVLKNIKDFEKTVLPVCAGGSHLHLMSSSGCQYFLGADCDKLIIY